MKTNALTPELLQRIAGRLQQTLTEHHAAPLVLVGLRQGRQVRVQKLRNTVLPRKDESLTGCPSRSGSWRSSTRASGEVEATASRASPPEATVSTS